MTNPMMYRVFLREERTDPQNELTLSYRVSAMDILAWVYSDPKWKPTLEEQIEKTAVGG